VGSSLVALGTTPDEIWQHLNSKLEWSGWILWLFFEKKDLKNSVRNFRYIPILKNEFSIIIGHQAVSFKTFFEWYLEYTQVYDLNKDIPYVPSEYKAGLLLNS